MNPTRPMYWSVVRELWENRSVYVAPMVVAGIVLFGVFISCFTLPRRMQAAMALEEAKQRHAIEMPYSMAASMILLTGFIVGVFYCVDALTGERRDRSILFWKSLPVSDRTAVLSKAAIPLVVQPLISIVVALIVQTIILILSTLVLTVRGINPALLWSRLPLIHMTFVMFYGVAVHMLWFAPIYAWLLLVSAWARRAAPLWALLPFFAAFVIERIALGTKLVASLITYRLQGAMLEAFTVHAGHAPIDKLSQLAPINFLLTPGLWVGLLFAAACLAAAMRLRRNREPI